LAFHNSSGSIGRLSIINLNRSTCGVLSGERFAKQLRGQLPFDRCWHQCVHDAVQPTRNDPGAVFARALRPSATHCVGLISMVFGSLPMIAATGESVFVGPGDSTVT